jgi:hypothetical protein
VASAYVYRRRWLPHRQRILLVAAATAPIAATPVIVGLIAGLDSGSHAMLAGFGIAITPESLLAITALLVVGGLSATARRRPAVQASGIAIGLSALAVSAFGLYQYSMTGGTTYYFQKAVEGWVVIALTGTGAVGYLLSRLPAPISGHAADTSGRRSSSGS